jgi:hypothetical protein
MQARVSLPMALAAAVLCFVLGRLTLARPPAVRPWRRLLRRFPRSSDAPRRCAARA